VAIEKSLATKFPDIAAQWHPTNNGVLTPRHVHAGSNKAYWWNCPNGDDHEWMAVVSSRTRGGNGCPFCSGKRPSAAYSLATEYPDVASEWHPSKNGGLTPNQVPPGSDKKVWWKCEAGPDHEWQSSVSNRTSGNKGCPFCAGNQVSVTNSLATLYPAVAAEWHPAKNGDITPDKVVAGSEKPYWWQCLIDPNHEWMASPNKRGGARTRCPYCANRAVSATNSLAARFPEIAVQWHPARNGDLTPDTVVAGSHNPVWWKCPNGPDHEWQISPMARTHGGSDCPFCANRKVSVTNSLAALFPAIAAEWHPTKNGDLTPADVVAGSNKSCWWQCRAVPDHEWHTQVALRTGNGTGCPLCNRGWTLPAIRSFVASLGPHLDAMTPAELQALCQQNGLLESKHGRAIMRAIAKGTLRPDEVVETVSDDFDAQAEIGGRASIVGDEFGEIDLEDVVVTDPTAGDGVGDTLPVISAERSLALLDSPIITSADEEVVEFFVASATAKLWMHAYADEGEAVAQTVAHVGGDYASRVRDQFLAEYNFATSLTMPDGYAFRVDGQLTQPNLMQRHVAVQVRDRQRVGNWSGTGAGKTLSAILGSRVSGCDLTVICCPNSVVTGWRTAITEVFPRSAVATKTFQPDWGTAALTGTPRYLILNYEMFQQADSEQKVASLIRDHQIDMVVIDEIHHTKQRQVDDLSKRRRLVSLLASAASARNSAIRVLGMSATPVINNLQEGKSLVELVTGIGHDDLKVKASVSNCMRLHQKLVTLGTRWLPNYAIGFEQVEIPVDCSRHLDAIRALGTSGTPLKLEQILTEARLPVIRDHIIPKTLIYTHYVDRIDRQLREAIVEDGWRVGFYTGEDKVGLDAFINGDIDVLIASSAIATGVDGLQRVCNRLIVNVLPWTAAEFEQLKGRIYRQGQVADQVTVILPLTYADVGGVRWSWCQEKMARLDFKRSIADAAVDGVVPEGHLRSPAQAYQDLIGWLARLDSGQVHDVVRRPIVIPLPDEPVAERARRYARFGDFSRMNRTWNQADSSVTHQRLQEHQEEWENYHALYREARQDWPVVPYEEFIRWAQKREDLVIGDFGCGEARVAAALHDRHTVHSFDHVAINEQVVACDMAHTPLDNESLDVALFSLSLMGSNFGDYLREAHRCLGIDGHLHIYEATSRIRDLDQFVAALTMLGFDIRRAVSVGTFTHVWANKSDRRTGVVVEFGIG
jgi:hypothetical protein